MLFFKQHLGPTKKIVCLLVLLSLWCSCCPCPRSLCACRHHGNPGKPRKPSRNNRNKQKTRAEKKHCNSIESFKYEKSVFFASRPTPLPPPRALSRNGGALSLNNVFLLGFSGNMAGRHSRWILSFLRKSLKTIFKSPPNCRDNNTQCAELWFWGELVEKKRLAGKAWPPLSRRTAGKRQHYDGGQKLRETANRKIKGQKNLATKALLWLVLIGDDLFLQKYRAKKQDCYDFVLIVLI